DPHIRVPAVFVTGIYPGADPLDLERVFAKPVEDRIAELDDVRKIETSISDGVAAIGVEFEATADADKKLDEVTREVNALRGEMPPEIRRIDVKRISPDLVNVVQVALVSADAPWTAMEDTARELRDALKTVPGVRTAESWAIPPRELRVHLDSARMAELGITTSAVAAALQGANLNLPAGFVDLGSRSFSLRTTGSFESLEAVRDTVVGVRGSDVTRLRAFATVEWATQPFTYTGRFRGERAVFVTANQKDGYNIIGVQQAIDAELARFTERMDARIRLEHGFRQSDNVAYRLNHLYRDFGIAIALVLLTLLPLGLRAASIVMVSIPLSLALGLTALYLFGFSLNQITIAGFVLSLGLLVDDSIVVVENIARHLREGLPRREAAVAATKQIFAAILGCTATLIFAFLPLAVLPGLPGKFIRVLPITIISTIVGSLIVALLFIPFLASRVLKAGEGEAEEGNALLRRLMTAIHRYYRPALHYCLARPKATVAAAIGGALALTVGLFVILPSSLFPKAETPQFLIGVEAPNGTSFAETDRALRFVETTLAGHPEVRTWFSNLGHGNPQIYYNHIVREDAANYAEVFVQLKDFDPKVTPAFLDRLRAQLDEYAGAKLVVREFIQGTGVPAPISIRVLGQDLDQLTSLAAEITTLIEAVPGTRDVSNPLRIARTNLRLAPDPQKAALLGVPLAEFDRAVRLSVSGLPVGNFKSDDGEQYPIVLRTSAAERADLAALDEVRVASASGTLLPLSQLADLRFEQAPTRIQRFNRERTVTINSEIANGYNTGEVTAEVVKRLNALSWPAGFGFSVGGDAEQSQEAFGGIGIAIIVALFGIFAILVLEFGDFRSTLIVLTVVPLGLMGGLLALLVTGNTFSFTAAVGLVALLGIEIKNSILLVDFTNQLREQGLGLDEAIEKAGEIRFLPILLTSLTAIGGLLPLALQGAGLYSPMAWTIIGGLVTSTLLARLVTPVVYKLLPPSIEPRGESLPAPVH
ncbi:MAG: efflux RND transporter permease subunit, partial [Steroidobacteraceae bacterium]